MGQQQLLLIILSVIIVGIAIAVGINMFQTNAVDSNRQAVIGDVMNLGAKAHRYFRTPSSLAGGGQTFNGFFLTDKENHNPNGTYAVSTTEPSGTANVTAGTDSISGTTSTSSIYIVASGVEKGNDGTNYVKVYATVTGSNVSTTVLN
jgi:Tfp pilus assembly protein PilE